MNDKLLTTYKIGTVRSISTKLEMKKQWENQMYSVEFAWEEKGHAVCEVG